MKVISFIIGVILLLAAIAGGLYLGLWLCLVGGIVQIVEACKADPINSLGIGIGALRFLVTGAVTWLTILIGGAISAIFFVGAGCMD